MSDAGLPPTTPDDAGAMPDTIAGTPRARQRPAHAQAPAHWTPGPPPPEPRAIVRDAPEDQPEGRDPVRYGDWEYKGLAIDF